MNNPTYLLKFALCSGIFLLFYILILSRLKSFKFNRFFLLFAVTFSMAIPFATIPNIWENENIQPNIESNLNGLFDNKEEMIVQNEPIEHNSNFKEENVPTITQKINNNPHKSQQQPVSMVKIFWIVYFIVSGFFAFRFLVSFWIICDKIVQNPKQKIGKYTYVLLETNSSPYTFFNYIFLDKNEFLANNINPKILMHEQQHAKELHSLDLLFTNLILVFAWMNPFVFLFRKYIRENHEYLADNSVIKKYSDKTQYQYLILDMQKSNKSSSLNLSNNFNFLSIKKRLTMINRNNQPRKNFLLSLFVIPLIFASVLVFAQRKEKQEKTTKENTSNSLTNFPQSDSENFGISEEEFKFYIAEMKKGNYKFDPKNRNRDWFKDLKNSSVGDTLIALYKQMTWQQKSSTWTKYHLFCPSLYQDSLSTQDFDTYNSIVQTIIKENIRSGKDSTEPGTFGIVKNRHTSKEILFKGKYVRNDIFYEKYAYINLMLTEMNKRQANAAPLLLRIEEEFRKPKPISPTESQMAKWSKNPTLWGVWLDGKRIPNSRLAQYKSSDVYYYDASNLTANAQKNDGFKVQLGLYTKAGYNEAFKDWK